MRNSLEEDDDTYFRRRYERRKSKCRLRCCIFGFTDIVYTGLGLIFCLTILGFHLRQDFRQLGKNLQSTNYNNTANNTTNSTVPKINPIIGININKTQIKAIKPNNNNYIDPDEKKSQNVDKRKQGEEETNSNYEYFGGVNWTSPYVFYGIQTSCLLLKLAGAILLFIGTCTNQNNSSSGNTSPRRRNRSESIEIIPTTSSSISTNNNSNNSCSNSTNSNKDKILLGICTCRTWLILNLIVFPFLLFKLVQFILHVYPTTIIFNNTTLLFIESGFEIIYRLIGLIFISDYLKFLNKGRRNNRRYVVNLIEKTNNDYDSDDEDDVNQIPLSFASCLFCKSWCMLANECC